MAASGRGPEIPSVSPPVRYVGDEASLATLLAELRGIDRYGFDTEFHRERTYFARLALFQLAWPGGVALIDPLAVDPAPLGELFASDALAIVHAGDQDLEIIERACGVVPTTLFDLQIGAGFIGLVSPSLSSVVSNLLGQHLEKADQLTDWIRRPLTDAQLAYAANDVAYLLDCYEVLRARLIERGRFEWAEEECAVLVKRARTAPVPEEAWWKLRQARQLRGRGRGVAQQLAAWRERRAQRLDIPVRGVLSDLAVVAIAQRPPRSHAELQSVRMVDGRHLGSLADEILAAVHEGLELRDAQLHLPPRPQGETVAKPLVTLAAAYVAEAAKALDLDPAILATRSDVVDFLRDPPRGRIVGGWRDDLVGEPIRRLERGDAALAIEHGALVIEERTRSGAPD